MRRRFLIISLYFVHWKCDGTNRSFFSPFLQVCMYIHHPLPSIGVKKLWFMVIDLGCVILNMCHEKKVPHYQSLFCALEVRWDKSKLLLTVSPSLYVHPPLSTFYSCEEALVCPITLPMQKETRLIMSNLPAQLMHWD